MNSNVGSRAGVAWNVETASAFGQIPGPDLPKRRRTKSATPASLRQKSIVRIFDVGNRCGERPAIRPAPDDARIARHLPE